VAALVATLSQKEFIAVMMEINSKIAVQRGDVLRSTPR